MTAAVQAEPDDRMLSVTDLRNYGISRATAFKLMEEGRLPFTQYCEGGKRTVRRSDVVALIAANTKTANKVSAQ